jgi:hypothetical protein
MMEQPKAYPVTAIPLNAGSSWFVILQCGCNIAATAERIIHRYGQRHGDYCSPISAACSLRPGGCLRRGLPQPSSRRFLVWILSLGIHFLGSLAAIAQDYHDDSPTSSTAAACKLLYDKEFQPYIMLEGIYKSPFTRPYSDKKRENAYVYNNAGVTIFFEKYGEKILPFRYIFSGEIISDAKKSRQYYVYNNIISENLINTKDNFSVYCETWGIFLHFKENNISYVELKTEYNG